MWVHVLGANGPEDLIDAVLHEHQLASIKNHAYLRSEKTYRTHKYDNATPDYTFLTDGVSKKNFSVPEPRH